MNVHRWSKQTSILTEPKYIKTALFLHHTKHPLHLLLQTVHSPHNSDFDCHSPRWWWDDRNSRHGRFRRHHWSRGGMEVDCRVLILGMWRMAGWERLPWLFLFRWWITCCFSCWNKLAMVVLVKKIEQNWARFWCDNGRIQISHTSYVGIHMYVEMICMSEIFIILCI